MEHPLSGALRVPLSPSRAPAGLLSPGLLHLPLPHDLPTLPASGLLAVEPLNSAPTTSSSLVSTSPAQAPGTEQPACLDISRYSRLAAAHPVLLSPAGAFTGTVPANPLYAPEAQSAPRSPSAASPSPPPHAPRPVGCLLPRMLATLSSQLGDHLLHGVLPDRHSQMSWLPFWTTKSLCPTLIL